MDPKDAPKGGPAFPGYFDAEDGMLLRDYFAAKAMGGMKMENVDAASDEQLNSACEIIAKVCYRMADAMMKARES